ncbi:TetR/AcrR family transcriptional regulator [Flindersiella endophytica]
MAIDHRKLPRRRGDALNEAILTAALEELAEVGYARLTMEGVAERAKASKATLYRRWQSRMELATDAVYHSLPDPASTPDTGSFRGDLLALLRQTADLLDGPAGEALRGLLGDALQDAERTAELRGRSQGHGRKSMDVVVDRAVARGEIAEAAVTPRRLEVGQAMLRQQFYFKGTPIPDTTIAEIVDEVLVPLFTTAPS